MAPSLPEALRLRSLAFEVIGAFFRSRGFVEVDAPLLLGGVPVESFVEVFRVPLSRLGGSEIRFLPPSPEQALKRALALLGSDCFEIGHAFRDGEEEGPLHRAHFRMIEWYRVNAGLQAIVEDTVDLFRTLDRAFRTRSTPPLPDLPVDIHGPWEAISVPEAVERHAGVPIRGPEDLDRLADVVRARGLGDPRSWQEAFCILLALEVEPHLGHGRPTILHSYPSGLAAQARPLPDAPWLADQFEVWVEGVELGNSYAEITDPEAQARRFEEETRRFEALGRVPPALDRDYLDALGRLPRDCAGGSVGLDRTLMLFLGAESIDQVRLG
ncbi:MAG: hypothetical protein JXB39_02445 [Deltaproteobacteria bacterium]|nr:hypothetical protein [Deltaproteobacteria bacterium]